MMRIQTDNQQFIQFTIDFIHSFNSIHSFIQTQPQFTESFIHSSIHSFLCKKDMSLYTGLSAVSSVHRRFCRIAVLISPLSHSIRCPFPSIDKIGTSDPSWITVEPSSNPIPSYASRFSPQPHLARLLRALHRPHAPARVVQRQLASTSKTAGIPTDTSHCARSAESRPRCPTR